MSSSSTVRGARSSSPGKNPVALPSSSLLNSPVLDADLLEQEGLLDADESGLLSFGGSANGANAKGIEGLSLYDSPVRKTPQEGASKTQPSKPTPRASASPAKLKAKGRPSWGPSSSPIKGKLRLLDGLDDVDSKGPIERGTEGGEAAAMPKKERMLGAMSYGGPKGAQKARQSIFAKPAPGPSSAASKGTQSRPSIGDEGDDSFYKNRTISTSTSSLKDRAPAQTRSPSSPQKASPTAKRRSASKLPEAGEHLDVQLVEVRRLNKVFDAYEEMLIGSMGQLEDFTVRIGETNALLDSYIDLMRQTERTQQLLLDSDWQGVSDDERMHALAIELAEREQRRRQEEAQEQARLIAQRTQEAEEARMAAELAQQQRQRSAGVGRGGIARGGGLRGSGIATRGGAMSAAVRGRATSGPTASTANRGRVASSSAAVRGAAAGTGRTVSASSSTSGGAGGGLGNRYGSVRSSGYGPRG